MCLYTQLSIALSAEVLQLFTHFVTALTTNSSPDLCAYSDNWIMPCFFFLFLPFLNECYHHQMETTSIFLFASFRPSLTLSHDGGGVSFWGLQSDYLLLSLHMIDGSHRNAVKIILEIY